MTHLPFHIIAHPRIIEATAFTDGSKSMVLVLFENSGGFGYINISVIGDDNISQDNIVSCYEKTEVLFNFAELILPKKLNSATLKIFRCVEEAQNCDITPPTCTDEILEEHTITVDIEDKVDTIPASPGPLTIIPGPGSLNIEWQNIPNIPVFAFFIRILFQDKEIISGYVSSMFRRVSILQLVPNRTYVVEVSGISKSNIRGEVASKEIFLPQATTSIASFSVIGPEGPVDNAAIIIDGISMGTTDVDGKLIVPEISADSEGLPHEYLVTGKALNNRIGTILAFPGISILENVRMSKLTPGKGAIVARVSCGGKPCEGTYITAEGRVRGITNSGGIFVIEDLSPIFDVPIYLFKPGFFIITPTVDIIENTTTNAPLVILPEGDPNLGIIGLVVFDVSGEPIEGAQTTLDSKALPVTGRLSGGTFDDKLPIGRTYKFTIIKSDHDTIIGEINLDTHLKNIVIIMYPSAITPSKDGKIITGGLTFLPKDENGNFLDIVTISVGNKYTGTEILNGQIDFINLPPGEHTFTASKEEYDTFTGEATVISDIITDVEFKMVKNQMSQNQQSHHDKISSKIKLNKFKQDTYGGIMPVYSKILTLDQMNNMLIDDIITLYRNGYEIEGMYTIESKENKKSKLLDLQSDTYSSVRYSEENLQTYNQIKPPELQPGRGFPAIRPKEKIEDIGRVIFSAACPNLPCQNVKILIGNKILGDTDINGTLTITGLHPGTYTFTALKQGFGPGKITIDVIQEQTTNVPRIIVNPLPHGISLIHFMISDINGYPIQGVQISIDEIFMGESDQFGIIIVENLKIGDTYSFTASIPGFDIFKSIITISKALECKRIVLTSSQQTGITSIINQGNANTGYTGHIPELKKISTLAISDCPTGDLILLGGAALLLFLATRSKIK